MPGRNLFAAPENPLPLVPSPKAPARNLLADDPAVKRANRLKEIAAAGLPPAGDPNDEIFKDSFTLGLQGPTAGLANALGGGIKSLFGKGDDSSFGERYSAGEKAYDERLAELRNKAGTEGTAAGLVGGLVTGTGPFKQATGIGRAAMSIPRLAAESAGLSGVEATARARGDVGERLKEGAIGTVVGGATGAAVGGLTHSFLPGFRERRAASREAARGPDPDTLRNEARQLYRQIDNAGLTYDAPVYSALPRDARMALDRSGYDPDLPEHASIRPLLNKLDSITAQTQANGGAIPFQQLQNLRTMATDVAASDSPGARRLAGIVRQEVDDFVEHAQPSQGFMGGQQANDTWRQARDLWRRASKTDDLLWNVGKAEGRAARSNSGGNEQNALRQNVGAMLDRAEKPGRYNPFSPEETRAMQEVSEGTPLQNRLRSFGNAFGGSGWGAVASGGMSAAIPHQLGVSPGLSAGIGLGLYGAGRGARALSTRMAQDRVDELIRLMATGSRAPAVAPAGPTQAISMADALAQRLAARTAPIGTQEFYSGGW